ncbi:MAG: type VI secretion system tip protein VgrG [Prolixibacteraceae bacterium]|jgi:Rhs element Vgr protein|nr:type VI secretion system tip protein VgrG [Prolixibacteraceae bacterium]MBT6996974.1 type VI secretion system tip protein VgrG [Prolixibacteraceae bacterium]MBT7394246.1 type VI secretion system tip protein VgrG [Prolixibacteraceae bacterium]
MPEQRVINTSQSADLVTFKIFADGNQIPGTFSIMSIVVEKEINRIPTAKIVLLDGDPASQDFEASNQESFIPGKEIEIKAGYHSDEETIFKGIVIKHSLKIRSNQSYLIVECKDKAVKLTIGRKNKYFYESKDSDIIEEIIDSCGLTKEVETTNVQHKELVQYNVSDWDFCVTRAQANGKVCVIDDGEIKVVKPDFEQAETETVSFGATLLDFDAEIDARNQFSKVTSYGWSYSGQELLEIEATDPSVSLNGNITSSDLSSVINLENLELKSGGGTPDVELQEWSDAQALFNQLSKIRGRVKFQGIPAVKPNTTLKLEGVGERFNGKVYISAIRHEISDGNWTIDAQFGINPKWFSETVDINDTPASGLLAAVNGLQVGIVTQLEADPDGEDRILVRFPIVDNEGQGIWARVATLDAGENRGSFFRPEIDDEVIVGFINGNPKDAIVLGMMNSSAKPAPITASDDNHEKGFVTRSEMKVIFNDDDISMTLETPNGNKMVISDADGGIKLEDENGNFIEMNSEGITIESATAINYKSGTDTTIESGTNLDIKAGTQLKAEGAAGAEVSTGAIAILKGSLVQIN